MAKARADFTKVASPPPVGNSKAVPSRSIDVFNFLIICVVVITGVSGFHVWSRFKLLDLNYRLAEKTHKLDEVLQQQKSLKLEAATLKTPGRIENFAKSELGMALPTEQQVIHVK